MGRSVTSSNESAFLTVPTSIGFNAGDLVYNQTGGYGRISDTAVSTATFPLGDSGLPITASGASARAQIYFEEFAGACDFTSGIAAKLTNGNIVIPYALNNTVANGTFPYFKIVDSNGTTVVAQTQVDTTNKVTPAGRPVLGALALPNGNFVVYYRYDSAGTIRLAFRIYNSSGVAQTAVITDTTVALVASASPNDTELHAAARSDSSFVVIGGVSGGNMFYRVYNGSSGATVYSGTWGGTRTGNPGCADVVVRSDNSWVMVQLSTASSVVWEVRSATNTLSAGSSYGTGYATSGISAVLMAGDVVRFFGFNGASNIGTNTITGNTVGSESLLYSTGAANSTTNISAYSFDSGTKFVLVFNLNNVTGSNSNAIGQAYAVFNSALSRISPGTGAIRIGSYTAGRTFFFGYVEVGDNIRLYRSARPSDGFGTSNVLSGAGIVYSSISKTTYLPVNAQSVAYSLGTTSAIAVSGYVRGSSTPTTASFYAAVSSGQSASLTSDTFLINPTVVESTACNSTQVFSKADGGFYYLYKYSNSPFTIKLATYNKSGVQQSVLTVDTGDSEPNGARMTVLSNGKVAVIYKKSNALRCKIYSSALVEQASTQIAASMVVPNFGNGNAVISAMGNAGRFVTGYMTSSGAVYSVCDDTGAVVNTGTVLANANGQCPAVCGSRTDGFMYYCGLSSNSSHAVYMYNPTGASTYGLLSTLSNPNGTASYPLPSLHLEASVDNAFPLVTGIGAGFNVQIAGGIDGGALYVASGMFTSYANFNPTGSSTAVAVGYTGMNGLVMIGTSYSGGGSRTYCWAGSPLFTTTTYQYRAATVLPISIEAANNGCPTIAPFIGDSCLISYLNFSNFPTICAIAPYTSTQFAAVTGGVSVSNPVTLSLANRFSLIGVAVTTAAAGSTGTVQIKGNAQVSSSYPSGTAYQPFDFRNQNTLGVAGSINGRILTLEN